MLALCTFDKVDDVLRVKALESETFLVGGFFEELRVLQQDVDLLAQAEGEAELLRGARKADEDVADVDQRLLWESADQDTMVERLRGVRLGNLREKEGVPVREEVDVGGRSEVQGHGPIPGGGELAQEEVPVTAGQPGGVDLALVRRGKSVGD